MGRLFRDSSHTVYSYLVSSPEDWGLRDKAQKLRRHLVLTSRGLDLLAKPPPEVQQISSMVKNDMGRQTRRSATNGSVGLVSPDPWVDAYEDRATSMNVAVSTGWDLRRLIDLLFQQSECSLHLTMDKWHMNQ